MNASRWAWASFLSGLSGCLLAATAFVPFIVGVSLLAWPLGFVALAAGWVGRRRARAASDWANGRRAGWGMALGCLGWIVEGLAFVVVIGLLAALLIRALRFS